MKLSFVIILVLFLYSCKNDKSTSSKIEVDLPQKDASFQKKDTLVFKTDHFNLAKFINSTNTLLTEIRRKPIQINYSLDTINNLPLKDGFLKRYNFDLGKGERTLNFWLFEGTYHNSKSLNKELNSIKLKAFDKEDTLKAPGLTYANDYVVNMKNKIYWLHTGCVYAYKNHLKLKEFLIQSLNSTKINEELFCECGHGPCH